MENYYELSEEDTRAKFIDGSLKAKWSESQIRRETPFTDGRITVRGKMVSRGTRKRTDYILYNKSNLVTLLSFK